MKLNPNRTERMTLTKPKVVKSKHEFSMKWTNVTPNKAKQILTHSEFGMKLMKMKQKMKLVESTISNEANTKGIVLTNEKEQNKT